MLVLLGERSHFAGMGGVVEYGVDLVYRMDGQSCANEVLFISTVGGSG